MFVKTDEYNPGVDGRFVDKITSLLCKGENIFLGREDGVVECYSKRARYSHPAFQIEFDYLENEDIKEKIIATDCTTDGGVHDVLFLGNEKSIKTLMLRSDASTLSICHSERATGCRVARERKCANVHGYVLNSLSLNASADSLLSADFIKINLWKPERMDKYYGLFDIKPQLSGGLVFVINEAKFSPFRENLFAFSASNGDLVLNDVDVAPRSQQIATMRNPQASGVRSVSDFSFVDANLVVARSLNSVCLFDVRKPNAAIFSRDLIEDICEQNLLNGSDAIYQTFKIANDGIHAYTGSYFNSVYCVNLLSGDVEEQLVGPVREFDTWKRVRLVASDGAGFACVYNGTLFRFAKGD